MMSYLCCCFSSEPERPRSELQINTDRSPLPDSSMHDALSTPEVFSVFDLDRFVFNDKRILDELRDKRILAYKYMEDASGEFMDNGRSGNVKLWFKPKKGAEPVVAKGQVFLPNEQDIDLVLDVLTSSQHRVVWDHDNVSNIPIREIFLDNSEDGRETARQVYNAFKGRFGQPGRDFIYNEYICKISESKALYLLYSNPDEQCPPGFEPGSRGNFVRAHTYLGAYLIQKEFSGIRMDFVNQTDIGGSLPDWIANMVLKNSPEKLSSISIYILRLARRPNN